MASFTPAQVIVDIRTLMLDENLTTGLRFDDPHMLAVVNQVLRRISLLRPDLFSFITTMNCATGFLQTAPADSMRIIDVINSVTGGNNLNEVNRDALDLIFSNWQVSVPGTATDWLRIERSPNTFMIYPPSANGQVLTIQYAQSPPLYTLNQVIALLPDSYWPCIVDGAIWILSTTDDEHVDSGRAKLLKESFYELLGMTSQNRNVTDTESGGVKPPAMAE